MNIFFLSLNAEECANLYCDQHVIKILLEIVQMLYTAWHFDGNPNWNSRAPYNKNKTQRGYKLAHPNHPMCLWVRSSQKAYNLTADMGLALAIEYTRRFKKIHACSKHILWLKMNQPTSFGSIKSEKLFILFRAYQSVCQRSIGILISLRLIGHIIKQKHLRDFFQSV